MLQNFLLNNKYLISLFIAIICIIAFIVIYKKYKLTKYQLFLFVVLMAFWSSIVIIRSYRKIFIMTDPNIGGLGLNELTAVSVVSIYGLISLFVRLPFFALSDYFKSRKLFIGLALVFIGVSSILVYYNPNYTTLYLSSLAIGIGASLLSMFNVMFSETFDKKNAIKSVAILSIAPLLAEFLMAPFQYLFTFQTVKDYKGMWLASAIFAIIAFIILMFYKDNKEKIRNFTWIKIKKVLSNKFFMLICIISVVASFIKFSTSGTNFVAFVKLKEIGMSSLGIAYVDVIFSLFQLIAGVLMGLYLKKKIGVKKTLFLGFACNIIFCLITAFCTNSTILFISYALNGFSYGLIYNILIGLAMQPFDKDYRGISMGIFQTFFAIGIYFGDVIYKYLYLLVNNGNLFESYKFAYLLTGFISLASLIILIIASKIDKNGFLEK